MSTPLSTDAPVIDGLQIEPLPQTDTAAVLASLTDPTARWSPPAAASVWWMHTEQPGGYVVGRCHEGRWTLAGPDGRAVERLDGPWTQIRLFRPGHELLIVDYAGSVHARRRVRIPPSQHRATQPRHRTLLLENTPSGHDPATVFPVLRRPDTGLTTVVPEPRSGTEALTLGVWEYFTADPRTGAVRIAAVCWDRYGGGISEPLLHHDTVAPAIAPTPTRSRRRFGFRRSR